MVSLRLAAGAAWRPALSLGRGLWAPRATAAAAAAARLSAARAYSSSSSQQGADAAASDARDEHMQRLAKYYPPHLIQSILAAESVVTPEMRANLKESSTEFAPMYADDYAEYDPLYDHAQGEWVDKSKPRQPIPQRIPKSLNPEPDVMSSKSRSAINLTRLEQATGLRTEYLKKLKSKPLIRKRVTNMTRLGKRRSIYALAVVGDGNGHVGIGEGRHLSSPSLAVASAHWEAAKNLVYIPRFKERTIYGNVEIKKGAVNLHLRAARPGSGLRVNHIIYEICKIAGIKDLVGNVYGSRNPMNVAKAAIEALSTKQVLIDEIAANRGKRVVDVTSTYLNF